MENEKRLIDANALIDWLDVGHLRNPLETCYSERDVVDMLESRPTVDAVEVVRCKDCKYRHDSCFAGVGNIYCDKKRIYFPLDGFCSYGERREGE